MPAGGLSLTGGAGQNVLQIIASSARNSDTVSIDGGSFTIPANTPGAGVLNYTLDTVSIASGAELALAPSDSQADQSVFAVNSLWLAGTLDITNNTLLANESDVPVSQVAAWVQNAGVEPTIMSSLVTGPDSQASRGIGYGDWNEDPLTVPAQDVEAKYVPVGDANLDGRVDLTDLTRAINNLGQSVGYYGGDILNQGMVNITDIAAIMNDLGANLSAAGDSAAGHALATSTRPPSAAAVSRSVDTSAGTPFSDAPIESDWLQSQLSILGD